MGNSYAGGNDHLTYLSALEAAQFTNKQEVINQYVLIALSSWEVCHV